MERGYYKDICDVPSDGYNRELSIEPNPPLMKDPKLFLQGSSSESFETQFQTLRHISYQRE